MQNENLIPASEFCMHHNIEVSFISSLGEFGLIEVTKIEETAFIPQTQLQELEKFVRLYYDLDINLAGIDAVYNLLQRLKTMHDEITALKNRLRLYEPAG